LPAEVADRDDLGFKAAFVDRLHRALV